MIRRRYLGGSAAVLGGLLAAACGEPTVRYVGQPQAGPAGPAGPAGAKGETGAQGARGAQGAAGAAGKIPTTVSFWSGIGANHPSGAARLDTLKLFNETMSEELNIIVDLSNSEAAAQGEGRVSEDKVKTMVAGGTPPDFYVLAYWSSAEFYVPGLTIDFDTELKTEKRYIVQKEDLFPHIRETATTAGKLQGMPSSTNNASIIYNKGRLQQAGVPFPPWDGSGQGQYTWDDFKVDLNKMQQQAGIMWAFSFRWTRWLWFLGTTGARPITDDGRKVTLDTPESVETLEYLKSIVDAGLSPPDGAGELYREAKNDIAYEHQGPFRIPTLRQANAPDFGVLHTPVHPVKREVFAQNGGWNSVVFKDIPLERRHAAAQVALWLSEPDAQVNHMILATTIPVSKKGLEHPKLQEYLKTDQHLKGFVDLAPYGWRLPGIPSSRTINSVGRDCSPIMKGEMGIQAWLTETQRELQVVVDKDQELISKL